MKTNIKQQQGVGLVEVLVALVLLAIGILGYSALQLRAMDASNEALTRSQAVLLLRGLTESIRANSAGQTSYPAALRAYTDGASTAPTSCVNPSTVCTAAQMATYDAFVTARAAANLGIQLMMTDCPGTASATVKRQCVFAAWGETTLTTSSYANCMSAAGVYVTPSTCLMMEAY